MAAYKPRVSLCTDPRPEASSIRPELTVIGLACEDSPIDEDLTILKDSLSSMNLLKSTQRKDFTL